MAMRLVMGKTMTKKPGKVGKSSQIRLMVHRTLAAGSTSRAMVKTISASATTTAKVGRVKKSLQRIMVLSTM
jgi:hypothetical protein